MDLTTLRSSNAERRRASGRNAAFVGVTVLGFLLLLAIGLKLPTAEAMASLTQHVTADPTLALRQDTEMPPCDGKDATNGLRGLMRARSAKVIGLSDIHEVSRKATGERSCQAVLNLDFSSQTVSYTIRRLRPGQPTWELSAATY